MHSQSIQEQSLWNGKEESVEYVKKCQKAKNNGFAHRISIAVFHKNLRKAIQNILVRKKDNFEKKFRIIDSKHSHIYAEKKNL